MNYEHIQESARDAKQMEENTILGCDPLLETCTCTRIETEFSQMCDYCQALEKKHPGYFAGLEPSWAGTNQGDGHDSDCATHNEPAYQNGACDCSFINIEPDAWASKIMCIGPDYGKIKYDKFPIQSINPLYYQHEKLYSERAVKELLSCATNTIKNLEIALRIKKEEHDCCAEDLSVYHYVEDKCGWSICQYSNQHGWIPVAWHDAVKAIKSARECS